MNQNNGTWRRLVEQSTLGVGVILVVALVAMVNYFGWKYYKRADWTQSRIYTLSDKSMNVLEQLDREIDVVLFMDPGDELYEPVREILNRYEAASTSIRVREVDPVKNLAEAQSLIKEFDLDRDNVVVFATDDDRRVIEAVDLADFDYAGMEYGQTPRMSGFKGEQVFTSTLLELIEARKPKIVHVVGHGEVPFDDFSPTGMSQAQDLLGRDNFEIEPWESLRDPHVPAGTDLVVIAGPTAGFIEPELAALRAYLESGGRMLVLLDPVLGDQGALGTTGLEPLLADYGVEIGDDIVVDPEGAVPFYGAETFFAQNYGVHPITDGLNQAQMPVIFPLARSVGTAGDVEGYSVTELVKTGEAGWGEVDLAHLDRVELDDSDLAGPVPLAVAVTASDGADTDDEAAAETARSMRLVVVGDSEFSTNAQLANVGNAGFLANAINWLVEREALVSIPPKEPEQVRLGLTRAQMSSITWLVLLLMPAAALAAGIGVHLRRRR